MFLIRRPRLIPLAAAAALSLSACGGDGADDSQATAVEEESSTPAEPADEPSGAPAGEPSPTVTEEDSDEDLPDGWTLAEAEGFSIGLPPGWFNGNRALEDEEFMAEVADQIEELTDAELFDAVEGSIGDFDLLALKTGDFTSEFRTNINVNLEPRGPFDEIEPLTQAIPDELEGVGATSVEVDEVEAAGMPSLEVTYELPDVAAEGLQHYLLGADFVVIATYTAVEPDLELWRSIMDTVVVEG